VVTVVLYVRAWDSRRHAADRETLRTMSSDVQAVREQVVLPVDPSASLDPAELCGSGLPIVEVLYDSPTAAQTAQIAQRAADALEARGWTLDYQAERQWRMHKVVAGERIEGGVFTSHDVVSVSKTLEQGQLFFSFSPKACGLLS
jgi:hypothetical protein